VISLTGSKSKSNLCANIRPEPFPLWHRIASMSIAADTGKNCRQKLPIPAKFADFP